jgi:acetylornithine deacetylase/succinyl-diaminopimelate desuccinylase-like protein
MTITEKVLARIETDFPDSQRRWLDWLRIPSISAQPAHAADCRSAAEFAAADLRTLGFDVQIRETAGHPVVVGHHPGPGGNVPHLL